MCSTNILKQLAERLGLTPFLSLQMAEDMGMNNKLVLLVLGSTFIMMLSAKMFEVEDFLAK